MILTPRPNLDDDGRASFFSSDGHTMKISANHYRLLTFVAWFAFAGTFTPALRAAEESMPAPDHAAMKATPAADAWGSVKDRKSVV